MAMVAITVVGVVDGSSTPVRAAGPAATRSPHDDHPGHEKEGVNVMAFSTPARPDWRWRIVDYSAQIIEGSFDGFPTTLAVAVAKGTERLALMIRADTAQPGCVPRWASGAAR